MKSSSSIRSGGMRVDQSVKVSKLRDLIRQINKHSVEGLFKIDFNVYNIIIYS